MSRKLFFLSVIGLMLLLIPTCSREKVESVSSEKSGAKPAEGARTVEKAPPVASRDTGMDNAFSSGTAPTSGRPKQIPSALPKAIVVPSKKGQSGQPAQNVFRAKPTLAAGLSGVSAGVAPAAIVPALVSITPNHGQQGQTITVMISARDTQFVPGITEAKFGNGISVGGEDEGEFGRVTVTSPTQATAQITIAEDADLDEQDVTVRTGQERVSFKDAFSITSPPVRLTVTPDHGSHGETLNVIITGQNTHFQNGVTEASFGDDVAVGGEDAGKFGPVVVSSPTRATVQIRIEGDADPNPRNVIVRTRQERLTLKDGFTVLPAPPRFTLSQNTGRQGQTLTITINGVNTRFRQGNTEARFGDGISVGNGNKGAYGSVTVNSPTQATARIKIDDDADTDERTVRLRTGDEKLAIKDAFSVLPAVTPITIVPNSGARAETLTVTITSRDAHFVQGQTEARFGAGIEVGDEEGFGPVTVLSRSQARAEISIRSSAKLGTRKVTVRTGRERFLLKDGFQVIASPRTLTVTPTTGPQGQTLTVNITGTNTHFAQGVSRARFGDGTSVGNGDIGDFGPLLVTGPTSASAQLRVAPDAILAPRTVTVQTDSEAVSLVDGFTVVNSPALITAIAPNSGPQGQTVPITITGQNTHFGQGTSEVSLGAGITISNVSVGSATSLTALASIAVAADLGTRTLTVTTGAEAPTLNNAFAVTLGIPVITGVNPNTGKQGDTVPVSVTAQFAHFVQGTTQLNLGAGITSSNIVVTSPTSLTAQLTIAPGATVGVRTLTAATGAEMVTLTNAFTITAGTPVLTSITPNTGKQGDTFGVTVTGQYTNFNQATTQMDFGAGITTRALSVTNATSLTAQLTIDPAATTGARTVKVITGPEVVTLNNGLSVTSGTPTITTVSPKQGQQGQSVSILVTGQFTNFVEGITQVDLGPGITVSTVAVTSSTSLNVHLSVLRTAIPGSRNLTVTTGSEAVILTNAFNVLPGPTITTSVDRPPNAADWYNAPVTVTFICADPVGSMTCPAPVVVDTEGANQVISRTAVSTAGIGVTASASISLDKTPPAVLFTSPANGSTLYVPNVTATGTVSDAVSGIADLTCNGKSVTLAGAGFDCPVTLVSGANSIVAKAVDLAGNSASANLSINHAPLPRITLLMPHNLDYTNISPTTVTGTVDDPTAAVMVNAVQAAVVNGSFSVAVPLQEGPNIITASATSPAGAVGTASIEVNLDTTPPHVTVTSPPDKFVTTDSSISIAGNINDIVVGTVNDQQASVTVNGVTAQVANRTFLATNVPLSLGDNVIQATGRDRVGNFATTQITVTRHAVTTEAQIRLISGNNQTGTIGTPLASPLVIALTDAAGNPAANKPVIFKVTQNNGMVNPGSAADSSGVATTNAQGQARVQWTLGMRAGAGGNTVDAYAVGFGGTAIFTASGSQGPAGKIVVDTGNNQIGAIGQALPKPLIAVVIDDGNNRLGGVPVTFTVAQGGGSFNGQPSYTVTSDSDGRAAATLTLGLQEGNGNNLVEANFPSNQSFPAAFTASGRAAGDASKTTISGVVLDNSNVPIPGVTIRAVLTNVVNANASSVQSAASVQTDVQGQFSIVPAPVGFVKLLVDGSTAQRQGTYPSLEYDMVTVSGQTNTVGNSIYLLPLNAANQLCVTATSGGGTLTMPEAPGFSLTFSPGQVTFPGGSKTGCISVTAVHPDKVPMVPGFGQQPRFIVTIQPPGAIFNPPAAITLPNVDGLPPRAVTEIYSYDHDISSFVAIGTGVVSDDGQVIRSSPGVGVLKSGWHCGGNPNTAGTAGTCPECQTCGPTGCVAVQPTRGPGPIVCSDDGNICTSDICSNGQCTHPRKSDSDISIINSGPAFADQCPQRSCRPGYVPPVNGCGSNDLSGFFVPNCLSGWGPGLLAFMTSQFGIVCPAVARNASIPICFTVGCNIHDQCYGTCDDGLTNHKGQCDSGLLSNLIQICQTVASPQGVYNQCVQCASAYFAMVDAFGDQAYKRAQAESRKCCP